MITRLKKTVSKERKRYVRVHGITRDVGRCGRETAHGELELSTFKGR